MTKWDFKGVFSGKPKQNTDNGETQTEFTDVVEPILVKSDVNKETANSCVPKIHELTYELEKFSKNAMIIFNHEYFWYERRREGTSLDAAALEKTFRQFKFDVITYDDLDKTQLFKELEKFSSHYFADYGCICVAILTHGSDHGCLQARDMQYSEREVFAFFDSKRNPTLAGKPIVFLIQACRGPNLAGLVPLLESGSRQQIEIDAEMEKKRNHFLPTESDVIIFHSCFPGRASARVKDEGTWFIQTICKQIKLHSDTDHLEKTFKKVRKVIALEKEFGLAKQMPVMTSTSLRKLYLKKNEDFEICFLVVSIVCKCTQYIAKGIIFMSKYYPLLCYYLFRYTIILIFLCVDRLDLKWPRMMKWLALLLALLYNFIF